MERGGGCTSSEKEMTSLLRISLVACLLAAPALAEAMEGIVTHVADGGTIEVEATAVRLEGIAVPELEEPGGEEAATYLFLLAQGEGVNCTLSGARRAGIQIGRCRFLDPKVVGRGETDLAAILVEAGLARDCPRLSGGRYQKLEPSASKLLPLPAACLATVHGAPEAEPDALAF